MLAELAGFLAVAAVVICTPGPDTALTVRNVLAGGRRGGVWTAAGVAMGQSVWTLLASAGVAGLLAASRPLFLGLKFFGVAYLMYLGAQSLRAAWANREHGLQPATCSPRLTPRRALRQGLVNNLANPKMAAFFTSLLPQFAPAGMPPFAAYVELGLLFCVLTFGWLTAVSLLVTKAGRWMSRAKVRRSMDAVAGCVLIGFGVRLAIVR